jgi:hypothetical protein
MAYLRVNDGMAITGSRIVMCVHYRYDELANNERIYDERIIVWDWKTGDLVRLCGLSGHPLLTSPAQVLNLSSADGSGLAETMTQVVFLDEFRLAVLHRESGVAELAVFNTLFPQDHPGNVQRLGLPPDAHNRGAYIYVDHARQLGTPNKDDTLIADPAQAVFVVGLGECCTPQLLLVIRTQTLIEQVCSVRADSRVPWDQWERDAVVVEAPMYREESSIFIHGAQVMVVRPISPNLLSARHWSHIYTFNFGRHGSLQHRGGTEILFGDGVNSRLPWGDGINLSDELRSLSDGSLFHLVSRLSQSAGSEVIG